MRKQDKYIFTGVAVTASIVGILDYFQQKERLEKRWTKDDLDKIFKWNYKTN